MKVKATDERFDCLIAELKRAAARANVDCGRLCLVGSTPLNAYGVRRCGDVDFIFDGNYDDLNPLDARLSPAEKDLRYYTKPKEDLIYNPAFHFVYQGIKIISLDMMVGFKRNRRNGKKDKSDILYAQAILTKSIFGRWMNLPYLCLRFRNWVYYKECIDGVKIKRLFGFTVRRKCLGGVS